MCATTSARRLKLHLMTGRVEANSSQTASSSRVRNEQAMMARGRRGLLPWQAVVERFVRPQFLGNTGNRRALKKFPAEFSLNHKRFIYNGSFYYQNCLVKTY